MKIQDLDTWIQYRRSDKIVREGNINEVNLIPANIKILFKERMLTASDLSYELLENLFMDSCRKFEPRFVIDKENESTIRTLILYLQKNSEFLKINPLYSFNKGIMLRGSVGTGKTLLFKGILHLYHSLSFFTCTSDYYKQSGTMSFTTMTSNKIAEMFSLDGWIAFTKNQYDRKSVPVDLAGGNLFIDDIGSEPVAAHYGQILNVIAELLIRRYEERAKDISMDRLFFTFATSNLSADQLKQLYGLRVYDRMKEMFNDIVLPGESRRK